MNKEIEKIILEQTDQRKAEMACELNRWKWPEELKKFKPDDYCDGRTRESYRHGIDIIHFIEDIIGHKAFLKEWNRDNMSEEEFETWYKEAQWR